MARSFLHRIAVGVLAGATLVAAPAMAARKARDCTATRQGGADDPACGRAAPSAEAAASAESARAEAAAARRRDERADYQLLYIHPDRATYDKLRAAELKGAVDHIDQALARLAELRTTLVTITAKAEFYKGKPLPPDLQLEVDRCEAGFTAMAFVFRGLKADVDRIVDKYRRPRTRLEALWGGAPLGSLGPYSPDAAASATN